MLSAFLSDAGHSVADIGTSYYLYSNSSLSSKVTKVLNNINFQKSKYEAPRNINSSYIYGLYDARQSGPNVAENSYELKGDTLFYRMDQFDFDIYDWNDFYKNPLTNQMPKDAVGNFKRMLEKYKDILQLKTLLLISV